MLAQYGYGDENNSWLLHDDPLVDYGDLSRRQFRVSEAIADQLARHPGTWAWQCKATVVPFQLKTRKGVVCPAQKSALDEERMALTVKGFAPYSEKNFSPEQLSRTIYQSYVWIMWVLCDRNGQPLFSEEPWRALLPFFTHGNIADAVTHEFVRREVVRKSLDCLKELAAVSPNITFRFTCSSDHSNCNHPLQFSPPQKTMPELLREESKLRLSPDERIRISIPGPEANEDAVIADHFSACHLPDIIRKFYQELERHQASHSQLSAGAKS
jgi:hypothetical protein